MKFVIMNRFFFGALFTITRKKFCNSVVRNGLECFTSLCMFKIVCCVIYHTSNCYQVEESAFIFRGLEKSHG